MALKLPPQDIEAEKSVLGSLMIDKNAIIKMVDILSDADFYDPRHGKIYRAIFDLFEKNEPVDILSVTNKLKNKQALKEVGGTSYLTELVNSVPTALHVVHYAKIVRQKKVMRDIATTSSEINEKIFNSTEDADNLLDEIEQRVFAITQKSRISNFVHIKDDLKDAYERIEKLHHGEGRLRGVPSGFEDLDNYLSGFQKSDLIVLGARPSLGKTSLLLDIVRHVALKARIPVGIFSLEMSKDQVIDRIIAAEAQVALWKLRTGRLSQESDFEMIQGALDRLADAQIYIDDTPSLNIIQIRSMARRLQIEKGLGLLVVDYLQLIQPRLSIDNMVQAMTEVSRGLKGLARELQVPILASAQLSRAVEQRDVKIPRLSDLRETGAIEQDSDVVLFIYRKDRDRQLEDLSLEEQNTAEIIIAKHRNGPIGTVRLKFDPDRVSFRSIDKTHLTGDVLI